MVRWLTIIAGVLAVVYSGFWFFVRGSVQDGIAQALENAGQGDVTISIDEGWRTRGFPSRLDTTFENISIRDELSGTEWSAPWLQIFAMAYRPTEVIAIWPNEQTITANGDTFTLYSTDMRASARVAANTSLAFETATVDIDNPRLREEATGAEIAMLRFLLAVRRAPETAQDYDLYLDASSIVLPEDIRRAIDPEGQLPDLIRSFRFEGLAALSKPLDRDVGVGAPVQVESLNIQELGLNWGDLSVSVIGEVRTDAAGLAEGSLAISAAGWRKALDMAVAAGAIEDGIDETYANMASAMDETPHLADTLTVTLVMQDGQMRLGPLPLGQAPRLIP